MPAQSGSTRVLKKMRRGYSREVYDDLISRAREKVPGITISSDFISGFCSETDEDHLETIDLLRRVKYEQAFMFAYSMREKTHAQYKLVDDVSEDEKLRRLQEVISTFREHMIKKNEEEVGKFHLVLIEGEGRKSTASNPTWTGRTDHNKRVVIPGGDKVLLTQYSDVESIVELLSRDGQSSPSSSSNVRMVSPGDYVVVQVDEGKGQTLYGRGLGITTLVDYHHAHQLHANKSKWLNIDQGLF